MRAVKVRELQNAAVSDFARLPRMDGNPVAFNAGGSGFEGSVIGNLPANIRNIIVVASMDTQPMVTFVRP
jgi:hypothetical protein